MDFNRIPPQNIEAEQCVLGSILIDNESLETAKEKILTDDFFREDHKEIYEAMLEVRGPIDLTILSDQLKKRKTYDQVGGINYLADIMQIVSTSSNMKHYIKIIKERSAQRKLINIARQINEKSFNSEEIAEIIQESIKDIQNVQIDDDTDNGYVPDLLGPIMNDIDERNKKGSIVGINTGFKKMNDLTGGWQEGRYYILGARPKMGKTSLFCQVADIASETIPTIIFSLEMTKKEVVKMLIYQNSKIDSMLEQSGQLKETDFCEMNEACKDLYDRLLYIDDRARTIPQILAAIKRIQKTFIKKRLGKVGLIVIDYVQLINGNTKLQRNYQLEEISRGLKEIAKDFNCCVLALSQLSRSVEDRKDCKPIPSDLKDSGSFEQDCDGLMLMYRDAYYNGKTQKNTKVYKSHGYDVVAEIVDINFFLNRHGPAEIFQIDFLAPFRKFVVDGK